MSDTLLAILYLLAILFLVVLTAPLILGHLRQRRARRTKVAARWRQWEQQPYQTQEVHQEMAQTREKLRAVEEQARENIARIERLQLEAEVRGRHPSPREKDEGK